MQISLYFPQLVLFGDSLTQFSSNWTSGIVSQLQYSYQRQLDVVNRGFSGYNTDWARPITEPLFEGLSQAPIDTTVVFFGSDDAATNFQNVPLDRYKDNIRSIAEASALRSNNVVLVGPAIVNEDAGTDVAAVRTNRDFYLYNRATKQIAEELNLPFVDLWGAFRTYLGESSDLNPFVLPNGTVAEGWNSTVGAFNGTASDEYNGTVSYNLTSSQYNGTGIFNGTGAYNLTVNTTFTSSNISSRGSNNTSTTGQGNNSATYLGAKGNPQNYKLEALLVDGVHFTDLGYEIWIDALAPILNLTIPLSSQLVLPSYTNINSTDTVVSELAREYVINAANGASRFVNVTQFA